MKKIMILLFAFIAYSGLLNAQTKIFKEISDDISSQLKIITQDNSLVGYLVFTRLEKASADSFNYKISIMDENLNDIGAVNFRDRGLNIEAISFEQDVLCISYIKSDILNNTYSRQEFKTVKDDSKSSVMIQFLSLNGKIIKTDEYKVNIDIASNYYDGSKMIAHGNLTQPVQLYNITDKGFACFYGDASTKTLMLFDTQGNQLWQKKIDEAGESFALHAGFDGIYLLEKNKQQKIIEGGFVLLGYAVADGKPYDKFRLQDTKGNDLRATMFDNDPATGKLYISGNIIDPKKGDKFSTGRGISHGPYLGLFTLNINGPKKTDIQQNYSYWGDGSQIDIISAKGKFVENDSWAVLNSSFKDYSGNTYFTGSSLFKKTRWGTIASSVILSPLLIPPIILLGTGTSKCELRDIVLIKQNSKGAISFDNSVPVNNTGFSNSANPIALYDNRDFSLVVNSDKKADYLVIDDSKNITVYNVGNKKTERVIPHKDGQVKINVYPAKEGSIMVTEYNKKEKYTKVSIESL